MYTVETNNKTVQVREVYPMLLQTILCLAGPTEQGKERGWFKVTAPSGKVQEFQWPENYIDFK